jgi:hypothetical protein
MMGDRDHNVEAGKQRTVKDSPCEDGYNPSAMVTAEKEATAPSSSANDMNQRRDPNVIDWNGPDDPQNPRNWSRNAKLLNCIIIILLTFLTPLGSSMFAPGVPGLLREFHTQSQTLAEFVVSIYILGYAVGPLLIGPASETYGRHPVYIICNVMFIIFTVACAVAQSMGQLVTFRFFAGG